MYFRGRVGVTSAGLALLALMSFSSCRNATGPGTLVAQEAPAQLTFEQDGQTIVLSNGDAFVVQSDGTRVFLEKLYDPDFYAKNYTVRDGQVNQVDPDSGELYPVTRRFREDFEGATLWSDLISASRWHLSNTDPARRGQADNYYNLGNRTTLSKTVMRSGSAVRFLAKPSSTSASKASLVKNIMYFKKGDHVWFSGWFFIQTSNIYDRGGFTLIDLESSFMQSVGLRVIFRANDALAFELELPKTQFNQDKGAEVRFPASRWVHVEAHAFLSDENGQVQIWQDGRKVLDKTGRTLPLADTVYDRVEVGVSAIAKGSRYEKIVYVDDVEISDTPLR